MLRRVLTFTLGLYIAFATATRSQAQAADLRGIVMGQDGKSLQDVKVTAQWEGGGTQATSHSGGTFSLTNVPFGPVEVELSSPGGPSMKRFVGDWAVAARQPLSFGTETVPPTWNVWVEKDESDRLPTRLVANSTYTFHFDLAGIDFSRVAKDVFSAAPEAELTTHLGGRRPPLKLSVWPFLKGEGLSLREQGRADLDVDVKKLGVQLSDIAKLVKDIEADKRRRTTKDAVKQPSGSPDTETVEVRSARLREISNALAAASIKIQVRANKPGNAVVCLAVWDKDLNQPLGLLTMPVTIQAAPMLEETAAMLSNSRLTASFPAYLGSYGLPTADASLMVCEVDDAGKRTNTVLFVEGQNEPLQWQPRRQIRNFVSDASPKQFGLVQQLEFVHCPSPAPPSCREDYSQVSELFSSVLFSDPNPNGMKVAKAARKALEDLVDGKQRPVVAVQFHSAAGDLLPVPLGLLGLSDHRLLGEVAHITQPLPQGRTVVDGTCLESFTTIIPTSLGIGDDASEQEWYDSLLQPLTPPSEPFFSDFQAMRRFFSHSDDPAQSEGLLMVVHHADGFVSFDPGFTPAMSAEEMTRQFAPGSAAILIGCGVGSLSPLNSSLPLLNTLNENGIDAMIFSPFVVSAELASRLAVHFSFEVEKARGAGEDITFRQLYERAVRDTRADFSVKQFFGELNEFQTAGLSDLRFCKGRSGGSGVTAAVPTQSVVRSLQRPMRCCSSKSSNGTLGGGGTNQSTPPTVKGGPLGPGHPAARSECGCGGY